MPCNARMTPNPATQCAKEPQRASSSYDLATRPFRMIVRQSAGTAGEGHSVPANISGLGNSTGRPASADSDHTHWKPQSGVRNVQNRPMSPNHKNVGAEKHLNLIFAGHRSKATHSPRRCRLEKLLETRRTEFFNTIGHEETFSLDGNRVLNVRSSPHCCRLLAPQYPSRV